MNPRIALFLLTSTAAFGQITACWSGNDPNGYDSGINRLIEADAADAALVGRRIDNLLDPGNRPHCFADFAVRLTDPSGRQRLRLAFERARTDKLIGAPGGTGGTSSLISRGAAAKALGFATEYGALTQSINAQVVTFSGNLAGIPTVLAREGVLEYCDERTGAILGASCVQASLLRALRRVSFGVSFDTNRGAQNITGTTTGAGTADQPVPVQFRASRQQVSNVTARVEIINNRDVTSEAYQRAWTEAVKSTTGLTSDAGATASATAALTALASIASYKSSPAYATWFADARTKLLAAKARSATAQEITGIWTDLLRELVGKLSAASPDFTAKLTAFLVANRAFDIAENDFVDALATKGLLTFEFVNNRPAAQTPVSSFRLIGEHGWGKHNNFTFNLAASMFDSKQPAINGVSTSQFRDIQAGGQYERSLGKLATLGAAALQFSGYFQNQRSPTILNVDPANPLPGITFINLPAGAKQVFAEKGNIGIGQVRFVLAPGQSSVRIPIAVSWSNRTELINKPSWRAQVGIAYDFDALFAAKQ